MGRSTGDLTSLTSRFQERLAKIRVAPWTLATCQDYRFRGVDGGTPDRKTRMMRRYMDRVLELSTCDPGVRLVLLEVFNILKPPIVLFGPAIAARVLRRWSSGEERSEHRRPEVRLQRQRYDDALTRAGLMMLSPGLD